MGHGVYGSLIAQGLHDDAAHTSLAAPRFSQGRTSFADEGAPAAAATVDAKPPSKDSLPLDIHVIIRKAVGAMTGQVAVGHPESAPTGQAQAKAAGAAAA